MKYCCASLRLIIMLGSLFLLHGCDNKPKQSPGGWGGPLPAKVMSPVKRNVVEWDEYTGRFRASKRVEIRARVSGYLNEVNFKDGQIVEKDQELFVIDPRPFQIEVDSNAARFEQAKKDLERAKGLRESRAISQQDYDNRLQEMRVAKAALDRAKLDLEYSRVKAPFKGRVSRNLIDEGNLVNGGDVDPTLLTSIIASQPIEFYFEASETDVLRNIRLFDNGDRLTSLDNKWPVEVRLQDEKEFSHSGHINFVGYELDLDTGTKEMRAIFENKNGLLEPGLFGRLRISTTESFQALLVPDNVIATEQTRKFVYVVGPENKATRKYLKLGAIEKDGLRIIKSGLDEKDQVIIGNLQMIQPGATIKPQTNTEDEADMDH